MEDAMELMVLGQYGEALDIVHALLADDPGNPDLLSHLGLCHLALGDPGQARWFFARCVELDSTNVEAWVDLGDTLLALDCHAEANDAWRKALELSPGHVRALISLAALYEECEDWNSVVQCYEQAMVKAEPWEAPRYELAMAYAKLGRYLEADILLNGLLVEQLRRGAQMGRANWSDAARLELVEFIQDLRSERERMAKEFIDTHTYPLELAQTMFMAMSLVKPLVPEAAASLYREIRALQDLGIDLALEQQHYRLTSLKGNYSGPQIQAILLALVQEHHMEGSADPGQLRAWQEVERLFNPD